VGPDGEVIEAATIFLTNRECPFRCVMCDLWRNTLEETVPVGAISAQIRYALERLPIPGLRRHLKIYNAGSFFDPYAIPPEEYPEVARLAAPFERVIVECHPGFLGRRCVEFREMLLRHGGGEANSEASGVSEGSGFRVQGSDRTNSEFENRNPELLNPEPRTLNPLRSHTSAHRRTERRLEVAIGLETAHPEVLARLNKRMTLAQFRRAAEFLEAERIDLRVFILVRPPWLSEAEGVEWARRSLDFAFACGASVCSLIPTRDGNGVMEALAAAGEFAPPRLVSVEGAMEYGLQLGTGRVFADLWEIRRFATCGACSEARIARLAAMNRTQRIPPPVACAECAP